MPTLNWCLLLCWQLCRLVQVFDPTHAAQFLTPGVVADLARINPIRAHVKMEELQAQLPAYLTAAARAPPHSMDNVEEYSDRILHFWRFGTSEVSMPAWRTAARIVFAISPNSATCERVFSLLDAMFGEGQHASLSDMLQASLLLRYNRTKRG